MAVVEREPGEAKLVLVQLAMGAHVQSWQL